MKITHLQTMPGAGPDPFSRPTAMINSIRSDVDSRAVKFYATGDAHPQEGQIVNFRSGAYASGQISLQDFLLKKVWFLGFKAGRNDTTVWIPDPWDANYLGTSISELHHAAAILDAQEKIVLDESGEFAKVGKSLLASNGPLEAALSTATTAPVAVEDCDVYVSHATEDKDYVEPLVRDPEAAGVKVWYDRISLK